MKKALLIFFLTILFCSLSTTVIGVNAKYNDSIEAVPAPVVSSATIDGRNVDTEIMLLKDADGNTSPKALFLLEAKDDLTQNKIKDSEAIDYKKIDESLDNKLTELAKDVNKNYTSRVFTVEQLFELSLADGVLTEDNKIKVKFDVDATEGKYTVIHKDASKNKWLVVPKEDVKVEDGKLVVSFSSLCPVAFLTINPDLASVDAPKPNMLTYILIGVSGVLIVTTIIIAITQKKKKQNK